MQVEYKKIRRALVSVSDKSGLFELASALIETGAEIIASGKTAENLRSRNIPVTSVEKVSGSPEAFGGRMKTLSFNICGGILYRRDNEADEKDRLELGIQPIDAVIVNFYPFERVKVAGASQTDLIEEIDIGGPTLVRAAAKNYKDVLVLTDPSQYEAVIQELYSFHGVSPSTLRTAAARAWERVADYDQAIADEFGERTRIPLKYGENPHQDASFVMNTNSPIEWEMENVSYNNVLDVSSAYSLVSDLHETLGPDYSIAVIVKHNNPCGVAAILKSGDSDSQLKAFQQAWAGDPKSAFGGVVVLSDPLSSTTASLMADRFVEVIAAPNLTRETSHVSSLLERRKKLRVLNIRKFGEVASRHITSVVGGLLQQTHDRGPEDFRIVTKSDWGAIKIELGRFGVCVCRALKSNAIAIVREIPDGFQLIGAGQGQPNRIDALETLAVKRAQNVLGSANLNNCLLVSDAFFPFSDCVTAAAGVGIRMMIQPGGSIRDQESIDCCNRLGIGMVFTGRRHFRH